MEKWGKGKKGEGQGTQKSQVDSTWFLGSIQTYACHKFKDFIRVEDQREKERKEERKHF